mmetsp:Transcript_11896/g.30176  ORF Transcript_11896/g.30176 Transcript_11896/m.30176 type:complete len:92 (-) Transcript_11896:976-1251(-)
MICEKDLTVSIHIRSFTVQFVQKRFGPFDSLRLFYRFIKVTVSFSLKRIITSRSAQLYYRIFENPCRPYHCQSDLTSLDMQMREPTIYIVF